MTAVPKFGQNPDLWAERAEASFSPEDLASCIFGGKDVVARRKAIADIVDATPEFQDPVPVEFMAREQRYENAARKVVVMAKMGDKIAPESLGEVSYYEGLVMAGETPPLSLHYAMFLPTIQSQASDKQQEKWLALTLGRAIIGTYAQTEMGHGTNLRQLETTATYDPKTQEFVLHMPTLTATKWWPGNLGKSSTHAVVVAQLWTQGKCHGVHPFMVQLRDLDTHRPLLGVTVGDIGPKFGINANDNGFLILNHVRIPRENMLMRNAKMEANGRYVPPAHAKLGYGSMVFVRSIMLRMMAMNLAKAATIATRYSCIRRQGELTPGQGEPKVLDYQSQQYRVLPHMASAYAFYFAAISMLEVYDHSTKEINKGNTEVMPELHALSSGLKAYLTWEVCKGVEQCRLACGGHGYLLASGLPELYGNIVGGCTYEGDNIVLLLQVARFLVKAYRGVLSGRSTHLTETALYLANADEARSNLDQTLIPDHLRAAFERAARKQVYNCVRALDNWAKKGYGPEEAWNRTAVQLCKAARAHVRVFVVGTFQRAVRSVPQVDREVQRVMAQLCQLFTCYTLNQHAIYLLEDGYVSPQQLEYIREAMYTTLRTLRPDAVAIADAWQFRDRELRSVLGRYDGLVYENLMRWAQHSTLNKKQVLDSHHKYLAPMMREARSKL